MKMLTATSGGRRCDPHLRMLVVGDASGPSGQNPAAMLLARGDIDPQAAYRWLHAEMNCVRASGLLQFTQPNICCHTGDAARVGKPAADFFSALSGVRGRSRASSIPRRSDNFDLLLLRLHHNYVYRHFDESVHLRHFAPPAVYCPAILKKCVFALVFCINSFWTDPSFCASRGLLSRHFAYRCWTVAVLWFPS